MRRNDRVINPEIQLTQDAYDSAYKDVLRLMFLARITRIESAAVLKSRVLSTELKEVVTGLVTDLQKFGQKTTALCEPGKGAWLTAELSKEKLFDMGNFIECAAQVNGEQYETVMAMGVEMVDLLVDAGEKGIKLDLKKLGAIARLWRHEIKAAAHLSTALVSYDAKADSLTFNMKVDGAHNR